jgi:hypothetical protein
MEISTGFQKGLSKLKGGKRRVEKNSDKGLFLGTPRGGMTFYHRTFYNNINIDSAILMESDNPKRSSFSKPLKGVKKGVQLSN